MSDRELLTAILESQRNLEAKIEGLQKEMHNRFDAINAQLHRLSQSQDIIVKAIHENKVEIELLKKNQAS